MPDWKLVIAGCLCILGGIILTHSLFLYSQFYTDSEGYMWRAARKIWGFLLPFFLVEWIIGCFFFLPLTPFISYAMYPILAAVIGFVVAFAPSALEQRLLPKEGTTVAKLRRPLTRMVLKLNLALRHKFAWAIESRRQQDLYDCQHANGWGLRLSWKDIGRRLRMLYEVCKFDIAKDRGDCSLLRHDVDHYPWEKFYLLVRHVGRRRLRQYLRNPVSPCDNWDGRERRKRIGTRSDRDSSTDNKPGLCRLYDDEARLALITAPRRGRVKSG